MVHLVRPWRGHLMSPFACCRELGSYVKVKVDVLGSPAVPNRPYGLCGRKATLNSKYACRAELRSCVKVEVAVLGSPSLIVLMVSVDVKQH